MSFLPEHVFGVSQALAPVGVRRRTWSEKEVRDLAK